MKELIKESLSYITIIVGIIALATIICVGTHEYSVRITKMMDKGYEEGSLLGQGGNSYIKSK